MDNYQKQQRLNTILVPILAILSGLLVAAVLILFTGESPIKAFGELFTAGFGCRAIDRCAFLTTLERATPLILTGLSAVVAFRSGMFSIGQEGQFAFGALVAAWLGFAIHLPVVLHAVVIMLAAMIVGGIYGWIPGVLKVKLQINEVITTLVMNEIALLILVYMVNFPLRADRGTTAFSPVIDETAKLATFLPGSKWGWGFVIAITAAVLIYFYLWRSTAGYEQRMAGQSSLFALFGGIRNDRAALRGMFISGTLAGLAGAIEVLGVHYRINQEFSVGLGFDGLSVAILGQVHPLGAVLVAILFAGVRLGAQLGLQINMGIPRELGGSVIAFMILFVAAEQFYRNNIAAVRDRIDHWRGRKTAVELAVEENN
ncbi:MAG: ABC transporter permease [Ardenticatenaceae bacterium]|nr:ABC transporter permease [Anaerolineales bacterium]MCB8977768.1 ABC transporter permease [Ardenticatenaceae bacterium]